MKNVTGSLSLIVFVLLSACAQPKTPTEFRQALQEHENMPGVRIDKFEVAKSYNQVSQFLKQKNDECMKVTIETTGKGDYGGTYHSYTSYEPLATITDKSAEISVRGTYPGNFGSQDLRFAIVAYIYPVSKAKTNVELYYTWGDRFGRMAKAYKMWASGQDIGCPNLVAN